MPNSYNKDYFSNRKLKWEKNHGKFIHAFMFEEYQNRILGQCNVALNDLQRQLDAEIARAKAEEKRLDGKIDSETARATAEEKRLDGKIDSETARATAEEKRVDGKIDEEITRAKGRENELNNSINACLPKSGGSMSDNGYIWWEHEPDNPNVDPFTMGGLTWSGATDSVTIRGEITGNDNLNLVFNMGDDNSNAIVFRNAQNHEVSSIHSDGLYSGYIDWDHIHNRPELDKEALDNLNLNLTTLRQAYMDLKARVDRLDGGH